MSKLIDEVKEEARKVEVFVLKGVDKIYVAVTGHDDPKIAAMLAEHGAENVEVDGVKASTPAAAPVAAPAKRVRKPAPKKAPAKIAPKKKAKR